LRDGFHQHVFVSRVRGKLSIKFFASVGIERESSSPRTAKVSLFRVVRRSAESIYEWCACAARDGNAPQTIYVNRAIRCSTKRPVNEETGEQA
jgi:hypothetical protein